MNNLKPIRKHPRLKGYDYSQNGAYFITICAKDRHEMLGRIVGRDTPGAPKNVELSKYGQVIHDEIEDTPLYYSIISVDKFVVMPNHIHMIVLIDGNDGAPRASRPTNALIPKMIGIIKRKTNKVFGFNMWQTSYHDHIIRNKDEYLRIWKYIDENPIRWKEDKYYKEML